MDSHASRKPEATLLSHDIQTDRKTFTVAFCENDMGKFVRLSETKNGWRTTVIIPEEAVSEVAAALHELSMRCKVKPEAS